MSAAARLSHDVGKYVARTAMNLPDGPVPRILVDMLAKDLYALDGTRPASAVLAERAAGIADARVERCRLLLAEVDGLEERVRAGEDAAVRRAAAAAMEVRTLLAAYAKERG